jgi:mono/diheme cytochrome c family protein
VPVTTTTTTTTPTTTTASTTLTWTWSGEVQPLLSASCSSCHGSSATPQYAGFANIQDPVLGYANTVNQLSTERPPNPPAFSVGMDRIEPGDHLTSYLWHKVNGTRLDPSVGGSGSRMPLIGSFLSAAQIEAIAGWIDAGAPNN